MKGKMQKFSNTQRKKVSNQRKRDFKKVQDKRKKKKKTDDDEIEGLRVKLWPTLEEKNEDLDSSSLKTFSDYPISKKTLEGLSTQNYVKPTDVQRESLLYGLKGHDILGAAKTGSGKTLAFLIPILETLFRQRYTPSFGMAALVISPTRELAYQSFDVLKKVGKFHDLSFGLVIGGMHLKEEAKRMNTTNVVICTPGRLQQHFEQTPNFTADELKVLVLDEADKILTMGFAEAMNAIVEALPKQRQTLLFSATQTKSVKDLARLSLKRPIYISVHEKAKEVTPTTLDQRYIVCDMHEKINILWSFIRSHRRKKMLVFLSCCKQVRYLYQVFKKMHPGLTILALHGHMKQTQRMEAYENFSRKQSVVLLATDVAARGLDFPVVNWVLQVDKPENVDTYIHRVGRTARYEKVGEALLMLLPGEEKKMSEDLTKRKIPIVKLRVSKKRMFDVTKKLESLCAAEKELKDNARKGFLSVMKTLYVLDKPAFETVDKDAFAASLGLVQTPKLPFLTKKSSTADSGNESNDDEEDNSTKPKIEVKSSAKRTTLNFGVSDDEDDDNIYNIVKDSNRDIIDGNEDEPLELVEEGRWTSKKKSTVRQKLKLLKQTTRITFDDDGNPEDKETGSDDEQGLDIAKAKLRLKEQDKVDKEVQRQRVKAEHREKRLKEKEKRRQAEMAKRGKTEEEEAEVVLGTEDGNSQFENEADEDDSGSDDDGDDFDDEEDEDDDDEDDEGPSRKRRKMDPAFQEESNDDEDGEDEEEMASAPESDDDDDDDDDDDSSGEIGGKNLEQDEAAVLALLGGKK